MESRKVAKLRTKFKLDKYNYFLAQKQQKCDITEALFASKIKNFQAIKCG